MAATSGDCIDRSSTLGLLIWAIINLILQKLEQCLSKDGVKQTALIKYFKKKLLLPDFTFKCCPIDLIFPCNKEYNFEKERGEGEMWKSKIKKKKCSSKSIE